MALAIQLRCINKDCDFHKKNTWTSRQRRVSFNFIGRKFLKEGIRQLLYASTTNVSPIYPDLIAEMITLDDYAT